MIPSSAPTKAFHTNLQITELGHGVGFHGNVVLSEFLLDLLQTGRDILRLIFLVISDSANEVVQVFIEDSLHPTLDFFQRVGRHLPVVMFLLNKL